MLVQNEFKKTEILIFGYTQRIPCCATNIFASYWIRSELCLSFLR